MPGTDQLKPVLEEALKNNKGPFGIILTVVALSVLVLELPADYITRLQETWFVIAIPATLILTGSFGQAYLTEQRIRTKVEEKIGAKLDELSSHIERLFASHFDDRLYLDKALEKFTDEHKVITDRLDRIFQVLEKRKDSVTHSGDTEKFSQRGA